MNNFTVHFSVLKFKFVLYRYSMWETYKKGFKAYLKLEKSLSDNSVEAYLHDVEKLTHYLKQHSLFKSPADIELKDLQHFLKWLAKLGINSASQARIIAGI